MKRLIVLVVAVAAVVAIAAVGLGQRSGTVDFRGEVIAIDTAGEQVILTLQGIGDTQYTVTADAKTNVHYYHPEDGSIRLEEIQVGDTVEGDYKRAGKPYAKELEVLYR